ncbi:uncharacterized protein LOC134713673 [Mytilus trossulus]|uniref:uncharacterized protein LOC134713673 n=1 Tax=Mytilus trossulus TaxID=6551 RepID=UPI003005D036
MNSITLVLTFCLTINSLSATLEDNKLQHLENVVKELQQQHQQQRQEDLKRIESLENELSVHNRRTRLLLDSAVPEHSRVSFMAHLSKDLSRAGNNHTIHFDRVITNNGHSYNPLVVYFIPLLQELMFSSGRQLIETTVS